ncbi:MAG: YdcF family protein [Acidobacteriota bacterium]
MLSWLSRTNRRRTLGKLLVTAGTVLLAFFSKWFCAKAVLWRIEYRWPVLMLRGNNAESGNGLMMDERLATDTVWVAVMGTGYEPIYGLPTNSEVRHNYLSRFIEAARICRALNHPRLAVSVSGDASAREKSQMMASLLSIVGLTKQDITIIGDASNTVQEAAAFRRVVGEDPVIVVSSALHIPRAVATFRKAGMQVIPAPTDYLTSPYGTTWGSRLIPQTRSLVAFDQLIHEYLGITKSGLVGKR